MKKIFLLAGIFALISISTLKAQVTFGANVKPDSSAVLDLQSNGNRGLLLPRVILTDTLIETSLATYEQGTIVYNTTPSGDGKTKEGIYFNDGHRWRQVNTGVATIYSQPYWSLNGNAGTNNSNFLGTTDNSPLFFRIKNNVPAGFTGFPDKDNVSFGGWSLRNPLLGASNTSFGMQALNWNVTQSENVAIGMYTLDALTEGNNNVAIGISAFGGFFGQTTEGNHNVAIGNQALLFNKQDQNTMVGTHAGGLNKEGTGLTAMGIGALNNDTIGNFNTAFGEMALRLSYTSIDNVAFGSGSLGGDSTGCYNTAAGNCSLHANETGNENTAFGEQALAGNIDGSYNTAVGARALYSVKFTANGDSAYAHGNYNTAIGFEALREITTGNSNIGIGYLSMRYNHEGSENIAIGAAYTLESITTGSKNVAMGHSTLNKNTTGIGNTVFGNSANISDNELSNTTVIGHGAIATESNQVVIGNSAVTSIGGYVEWTTISDGRVKENIKQNVPGLEFINLLQPVTYHLDLDAADKILRTGKYPKNDSLRTLALPIDTKARELQQKRVYTGLVAQEVEKAAKSIGYDFSGVDATENENGLYGLCYSEFVVPLVKSVQELSAESKATDDAIASWQNQIKELTGLVNQLLEKKN